MDWPERDELKQLLDVTSADWDDHLDNLLTAAIEFVKLDVGSWEEYADEPDEALRNAALRAAALMRANGIDPREALSAARVTIKADAAYEASMYGHRRRFGIA